MSPILRPFHVNKNNTDNKDKDVTKVPLEVPLVEEIKGVETPIFVTEKQEVSTPFNVDGEGQITLDQEIKEIKETGEIVAPSLITEVASPQKEDIVISETVNPEDKEVETSEIKETDVFVADLVPEVTPPQKDNEIQFSTPNDMLLEEVKSEKENEEKDQIISKALQKLLERKIEKTIVNAETALESFTPVAVPSVNVASALPENKNENATLPQEGVLHNAEMVASAGQEIHIPIVQGVQPEPALVTEEIAPAVQTNTSDGIPATIVTESIPVAEVKEVLPTTTTTLPTTALSTPVIANVSQNTIPQVPEVVVPKVHWFDKLFGSAPKTPPQAV